MARADILQTASDWYDDIMAAGSSAAYDIAGPECKNPKIDLDRAQKALQNTERSCRANPNTSLTSLALENAAQTVQVTQTELENGFLSKLAQHESQELDCAANFAQSLPQNEKAFASIQNRVQLLREARQKLQNAVADLNSNEMTRGRLCPLILEELKPDPVMVSIHGYDPFEKNCRIVIAARQAVNVIMASIPLSGTKSVLEYIDHYSTTLPGPEADKMKANLAADLAKAYAGAQKELLSESERFKKLSDPAQVAKASREVKGSLISDPLTVQSVINSAGADGEFLQGVACSVDAKYGRGAELLQTGLFVGSLALSGGGALMVRAGSTAARALAATRFARLQGLVSFQSSRMLAVGAGALDAASVAETITRTCNSNSAPHAKVRRDGFATCVRAPQIQSINQDNCYLEATLSAGPFALLGLGLVSKNAEKILVATEKDRETAALLSDTVQNTTTIGMKNATAETASGSGKPGSIPHRGKLLSPGAQENYVYLHDTDPNKVVKVQITDPAEYRSSANPTSVEQTTQINKARFARKEVIQDALTRIPEKDRIPLARMEFHDGYAYQDYIKDGMTLAEFQKRYGEEWQTLREEFNRRLRISSEAATSEMNKFFRENTRRPATLGDQLAGTARPDINSANFIIKIPPGGPGKVRVEDITWIDW